MGWTQKTLESFHFQLALVWAVAFIFRALPLFEYSAWGNDFGIYSGLTESFINTKQLFPPYSGWGASYQYFPVLPAITAGTAQALGLRTSQVLPWMAPVFGSLSVVFTWLIARRLLPHDMSFAALLAGLLVAVNSIHLFETSQPYPLVLGHVFLLATIYLYLDSHTSNVRYALMFATGALCVMSHHLSTYMLLISIAGAVIARNVLEDWDEPRARREFLFLGVLLSMCLGYWFAVVDPLRRWLQAFFSVPLPVLLAAGLVAAYIMFLALRRLHPRLHPAARRFLFDTPDVPDGPLLAAALVLVAGGFVAAGMYGFGPVRLSANPSLIAAAVPTIVFFALAAAGAKHLKAHPVLLGWTLALGLSLAATSASWSRMLYPERHLEYLVEPMSIGAAILVWAWLGKRYRRSIGLPWMSRESSTLRGNWEKALPVAVVCLVILNGFASTPQAAGGSYSQGISFADELAVSYIRGNATPNMTVATDHRLGNLVNGSGGPPCTFEKAMDIWTQDGIVEYIGELEGNESRYPPIGYVLIDDVMQNRSLVLVDNGPHGSIILLEEWSHEKFNGPPFEQVFFAQDQNGAHWARVYAVNWTIVDGVSARD